jgi:DNA-directed RNA polymerase subunit beta
MVRIRIFSILFGLSEEVPAEKGVLKKCVGRKLAARVLKTWIEDFVDEDTGEVVSIDRNEVLLERDSILSMRMISIRSLTQVPNQ